MRYYATVGPIDIITKSQTCRFFRDKKRNYNSYEAMCFFFDPSTYQLELYGDYEDAILGAARISAQHCEAYGLENKFLQPKTFTAPIFIVEVPNHTCTGPWHTSQAKFTSKVEKKVASYFGVHDDVVNIRSYTCSKSDVTNLFAFTLIHPYFENKFVDMEWTPEFIQRWKTMYADQPRVPMRTVIS